MRIKILLEFTRLFKLQNVVQIQFISIQSRGGGGGGLIYGLNGQITGWGAYERKFTVL